MTNTPKSAALKNTGIAVIKSEVPSVKPKRQYGEFDRFVAIGDWLVAAFKGVSAACERLVDDDFKITIYAVEEAQDYLTRLPKLKAAMNEFKQGEEWFNREELYENGNTERWTLSRRVIAETIGLLLASFPNSNPGSAKVVAKMAFGEP
jgi:hypothetical protein